MSEVSGIICKGCPAQCELMQVEVKARLAFLLAQTATEQSLMGEGGKMTDDALRMLAEATGATEVEVAEAAIGLRTLAAETLDDLEAQVEGIRKERTELAETCSRPVAIIANANGQQFTVSLCTSPNNYSSDNLHAPTHVFRAFEG